MKGISLSEGGVRPKAEARDTQTKQENLGVYKFLARRNWPKSYLGKIMLVAFLGTHIPLLALFACSVSLATHDPALKTRFLLIALAATLVGAGLTLMMLNHLLAPITATFRGLRHYLEKKTLPELPTQYTDEAGILMSDTMSVIGTIDEAMHQLKNYDPLTGLPNRTLFCDRVQQMLATARRANKLVAVLVLDVDDFTAINYSAGQENGDMLLRQIAARLRTDVREVDMLSRLSNDEFAFLHNGATTQEEISVHAQRLLDTLQKPFLVAGRQLNISASIGIALADATQEIAPLALLNDAEAALHDAKISARNSYCYHSSEMNEKMRKRLETTNDLRGALERSEFEVWYQPQFDTARGRITGMEALIRWHHPTQGLVSPFDFIPAAESSGLIVPIGKWVLETACAQARAWQQEGLGELRVAVNLSATQFQQSDLIEMVRQTLHKTQLDPKLLELEITESLLMDADGALKVLDGLHELGVILALDDFGTGFSSLSYLKRFPLDVLKIDRSFIRDVPNDSNDSAITRSIIALAQGLKLDVIAEGVETQEQVDYLHQNGCQHLQGFHFSRPVPSAQFAQMMRK